MYQQNTAHDAQAPTNIPRKLVYVSEERAVAEGQAEDEGWTTTPSVVENRSGFEV